MHNQHVKNPERWHDFFGYRICEHTWNLCHFSADYVNALRRGVRDVVTCIDLHCQSCFVVRVHDSYCSIILSSFLGSNATYVNGM